MAVWTVNEEKSKTLTFPVPIFHDSQPMQVPSHCVMQIPCPCDVVNSLLESQGVWKIRRWRRDSGRHTASAATASSLYGMRRCIGRHGIHGRADSRRTEPVSTTARTCSAFGFERIPPPPYFLSHSLAFVQSRKGHPLGHGIPSLTHPVSIFLIKGFASYCHQRESLYDHCSGGNRGGCKVD